MPPGAQVHLFTSLIDEHLAMPQSLRATSTDRLQLVQKLVTAAREWGRREIPLATLLDREYMWRHRPDFVVTMARHCAGLPVDCWPAYAE